MKKGTTKITDFNFGTTDDTNIDIKQALANINTKLSCYLHGSIRVEWRFCTTWQTYFPGHR